MQRPAAEPSAPGEPRIGDLLDPAEIRELMAVPRLRPSVDIALTWVWILATLALYAAWPSPLLFIPCFVIIASRQLALTHLVHDASHYRLFPSRRANDLLSDLLAAGPVLISTQSYRVQHLPHHQYLGDHRLDSDRRTWYTIRGWHFLRRTLLTLVGFEALKTFVDYARASGPQPDGGGTAPRSGLAWRALCALFGNGLLFAWCLWLGAPWLFLCLWLAPLFTLTMYLLILRVLAEHQPLDYARRGGEFPDQDIEPPLVRTVRPGLLGRFLLGPMNFCYHHEHHLAPGVPYASLPQLHRRLLATGYYDRHPEALGRSYLSVLVQLIFPGRGASAHE